MRKLIFVFIMLCAITAFTARQSVYAATNPTSVANNKFGIHLAVPNNDDLQAAAKLVNSSGGQWGYVTVVIQENDRNVGKWQEVFNEMRRLKLIPIVRIATQPEGAVWRKPSADDADAWVAFFQQLNWVVKNRYIVLFNEPNHASEWGGAVNPEEYATVSEAFAKKLRAAGSDYFIMLAGLDLSAPSQGTAYEDAGNFYSRMFSIVDSGKWNELVDGLSSHAYPNPGFVGSPYNRGRISIGGYEWELSYLASLGISKPLPVFITETGWKSGSISEEDVSQYMVTAYRNLWLQDERVVAVTPFVLSYQSEPFLGFSWKKEGTHEYYPVYQAVQDIEKAKGVPIQNHSLKVISDMPSALTSASTIVFTMRIKNEGQTIIDGIDYRIAITNLPAGTTARVSQPSQPIEPGAEAAVSVSITTGTEQAQSKASVQLMHISESVGQVYAWNMEIIPKISLKILVQRLFGFGSSVDQYEVQLFDNEERMVFRQVDVIAENGVIFLDRVPNLIVGREYRIVVLRPYYLPRQSYVTIQKDGNEVSVKRMLPLDPNNDGKFSVGDVITFIPNAYRYL
ncbi:MAG: glycoside hydrolase family 5 protein [Candidatus Roizmanbacteria bacterium]|nr:glycoside hydrolase family 5 protein [Candidatus Roizmanbacteria bacterium]